MRRTLPRTVHVASPVTAAVCPGGRDLGGTRSWPSWKTWIGASGAQSVTRACGPAVQDSARAPRPALPCPGRRVPRTKRPPPVAGPAGAGANGSRVRRVTCHTRARRGLGRKHTDGRPVSVVLQTGPGCSWSGGPRRPWWRATGAGWVLAVRSPRTGDARTPPRPLFPPARMMAERPGGDHHPFGVITSSSSQSVSCGGRPDGQQVLSSCGTGQPGWPEGLLILSAEKRPVHGASTPLQETTPLHVAPSGDTSHVRRWPMCQRPSTQISIGVGGTRLTVLPFNRAGVTIGRLWHGGGTARSGFVRNEQGQVQRSVDGSVTHERPRHPTAGGGAPRQPPHLRKRGADHRE